MSLGRFLIHVGVEGVAGEGGEVLDVVQRDRAFLGNERPADVEIFEVIAERMEFAVEDGSALRPASRHAGKHRGRALQRSTLHVVMEAAYAAQFLAAAGPARTAMHHLRHRGPVTRLLLAAAAINKAPAPGEAP